MIRSLGYFGFELVLATSLKRPQTKTPEKTKQEHMIFLLKVFQTFLNAEAASPVLGRADSSSSSSPPPAASAAARP